jgi:hypothetical protein
MKAVTIKTGYEIKYIKKGGKRASRNPIYGFSYKDIDNGYTSYLNSIHEDNADIYIESIEDLKFKLINSGKTIIDITEFEYYVYDNRTFSSMDDVNNYIDSEIKADDEAADKAFEEAHIGNKVRYENHEASVSIYTDDTKWVHYNVNTEEEAINQFKAQYGDILIKRICLTEAYVTAHDAGYILKDMVEEPVVDPEMVEKDVEFDSDKVEFDSEYYLKNDLYMYDIECDGKVEYLFMNKFNNEYKFMGFNHFNKQYTIIDSKEESRFCVLNNKQYLNYINVFKGVNDMNYDDLYDALYNQYEYLYECEEFGDNLNDIIKTLELRLIKFDNTNDFYLKTEYDVINNWLYNFRQLALNSEYVFMTINDRGGTYMDPDECVDLNKLIFN